MATARLATGERHPASLEVDGVEGRGKTTLCQRIHCLASFDAPSSSPSSVDYSPRTPSFCTKVEAKDCNGKRNWTKREGST